MTSNFGRTICKESKLAREQGLSLRQLRRCGGYQLFIDMSADARRVLMNTMRKGAAR